MSAPEKHNSIKHKSWGRKDTLDFLLLFFVALSISICEYFRHNLTPLFIIFVIVPIGYFYFYADLKPEERNRIVEFLFHAGVCAGLLILSYCIMNAGREELSSPKRDIVKCIGGFFMIGFACMLFLGVFHFAAQPPLDPKDSDSANDL